jgi:hypothetical protein
MVQISTFSGFMTAIQGTEDIVLTADLDAQAEGFEYVDSLNIRCNLDGQGHSISNIIILNKNGLVFSCDFVKNVEFIQLLVKGTDNSYTIAYTSGKACTVENCLFGMGIDCAERNLYVGSSNGSFPLTFKECAFDITVQRGAGLGIYNYDSYQKCNFVIRNLALAAFTWSKSQIFCAFVLYQCHFVGGYSANLSYFQSSYLTLEECTGALNVYGNNSSLFCNHGSVSVSSVSGVRQVTAEQLQSESYLREIGFLP